MAIIARSHVRSANISFIGRDFKKSSSLYSAMRMANNMTMAAEEVKSDMASVTVITKHHKSTFTPVN